jgi:hypothetical protein
MIQTVSHCRFVNDFGWLALPLWPRGVAVEIIVYKSTAINTVPAHGTVFRPNRIGSELVRKSKRTSPAGGKQKAKSGVQGSNKVGRCLLAEWCRWLAIIGAWWDRDTVGVQNQKVPMGCIGLFLDRHHLIIVRFSISKDISLVRL